MCDNCRLLVYDTSSFQLLSESRCDNCVNAVHTHPSASLLVTSTGQRSFDIDMDNDSDSDSDSDSDKSDSDPDRDTDMTIENDDIKLIPREKKMLHQRRDKEKNNNSSGVQLWKWASTGNGPGK